MCRPSSHFGQFVDELLFVFLFVFHFESPQERLLGTARVARLEGGARGQSRLCSPNLDYAFLCDLVGKT